MPAMIRTFFQQYISEFVKNVSKEVGSITLLCIAKIPNKDLLTNTTMHLVNTMTRWEVHLFVENSRIWVLFLTQQISLI